jgi:hypothetical protein
MLEMTPDAKRYLANLRRERGVGDQAGARLVSKGGRVGLTFAPAPVGGHRVVDGEVMKIYVPPEIAETLGESIIDVRDENGQTKLVMRKQATRTKAAKSIG